MDKEKYIGSAKLIEEPKKALKLKLGEKVVDETKLSDALASKINDMKNQIDSLNKDEYGKDGIAVSNAFGHNPHIGISQNTLTIAFNNLWQKIEEITGESLRGISMEVTPDYFLGNEGCEVLIKAYTANTIGIFEHIEFLVDGEKVYEADDKDYVEFTTEIDHTSQLTCNAQIMGIPYTVQKMVYHYDAFWIGGGSQATDVMSDDAAHLVTIDKCMRAAKDVTLTNGQHIILVMGEYLRDGFIRADINGVEIDFTESTITQNGNTYKVFTSVNTYQAGTLNIDING